MPGAFDYQNDRRQREHVMHENDAALRRPPPTTDPNDPYVTPGQADIDSSTMPAMPAVRPVDPPAREPVPEPEEADQESRTSIILRKLKKAFLIIVAVILGSLILFGLFLFIRQFF